MDEEYDRGRILAQRIVPVLPNDTAEELAARVLHQVMKFYVRFYTPNMQFYVSFRCSNDYLKKSLLLICLAPLLVLAFELLLSQTY